MPFCGPAWDPMRFPFLYKHMKNYGRHTLSIPFDMVASTSAVYVLAGPPTGWTLEQCISGHPTWIISDRTLHCDRLAKLVDWHFRSFEAERSLLHLLDLYTW
ncbi:hypothetical protein ABZP36_007581 [Zizania latifolia]